VQTFLHALGVSLPQILSTVLLYPSLTHYTMLQYVPSTMQPRMQQHSYDWLHQRNFIFFYFIFGRKNSQNSVTPVNTVKRRTCFLSQTLPVFRHFVTSRRIVLLFGNSLSGDALINVSRTSAKDFDAK
jgi:hypothetical protein